MHVCVSACLRLNIITLTVSIHFNNNYSLVAHSFSFRSWFSLFLYFWLAFCTTSARLNEKLHRICGHTNVVYTQQLLCNIFFISFFFFVSFTSFVSHFVVYLLGIWILIRFFVVLYLGSWTDNLACEYIFYGQICAIMDK